MKKKDYINILIVSLVALVVVFASILFTQVFGSDTDWVNQHTIFPEYLRMMFYKTGKLIPNLAFHYGAGQNIFNISYYGLLSPIVLISYMLPFMSMTLYTVISSIALIILSGYLFYKWLFNNDFSSKVCFISSLIFILATPFIFHMHRHIMFVNYMPFLIMSLIGIDKLIKNGKKSYFVIGVFLMIMTSYYYSVCGLLVIGTYYIFKYLEFNKEFNTKKFVKDLTVMIMLALLAVSLSAILLLPTIYTLMQGRSEATETFTLLKLLTPNLKVHKIFCGTYQIGLSMIGFVSFLYLFFSKKRENITLGVLTGVVLFIPLFMYLLNGGLYLREKCFIPYIPLVSYMIAKFIKDLYEGKIDLKKFVIYLLIINIPLYFFNRRQWCYLYLLGIIICLILLYYKKGYKYLLCILVIGVSFVHALVRANWEDVLTIEYYKELFSPLYANAIDEVISKDSGYYRTNNMVYPLRTVNKIYNNKYYTTNFYSSTYNGYYLDFIREVMNTNTAEYNYFLISASSNILFNKYMGVKYIYSDHDLGLGYTKIFNNMYMNNEVFPLGYVSYNSINEEEFDKLDYPFNIEVLMNNVISKTSNNHINDLHMKKIDLSFEIRNMNTDNITITNEEEGYKLVVKSDDTFTVKLNDKLDNQLLFITLNGLNRNSCSNGNTFININNVNNMITCSSWPYHNKNESFTYLLSGDLDELNVEIGKGTYIIKSLESYTLDYDYVKYSNRNVDSFNITEITDNKIAGSITAKQDGYFVMSVPYDEGFTIKVNGKIVEKELVNKAFIGFKIDKGTYDVEIMYNSPLLREGKIISLLSVFVLIAVIYYDKKNYRKEK